jgi:hypothetical protein
MFLRRSTVGQEPLPLSMSGVRAGERLLQIGLEDPHVATAIAAKVGLNGHASFVVGTEREAEQARAVAANAGVLADVHVRDFSRDSFSTDGTEDRAWPADDASIDVIVIHGRRGLLAALEGQARLATLRRCLQALRVGGRLVAVDTGRAVGLAARLGLGKKPHAAYEAAGGTAAALAVTGFRPVRVLGELEGYKFTEGLRPPR